MQMLFKLVLQQAKRGFSTLIIHLASDKKSKRGDIEKSFLNT